MFAILEDMDPGEASPSLRRDRTPAAADALEQRVPNLDHGCSRASSGRSRTCCCRCRSNGKPTIREMCRRRAVDGGLGGGIRLRLMIPRGLAPIPWEYPYGRRAGGYGMDRGVPSRWIADCVCPSGSTLGRFPTSAPPADRARRRGTCASATGFRPWISAPKLPPFEPRRLRPPLDGVRSQAGSARHVSQATRLIDGAPRSSFRGPWAISRGRWPTNRNLPRQRASWRFEDHSSTSEQVANQSSQPPRAACRARCLPRPVVREGNSIWSGIAPV